ncbi:nitroreductase [Streptomyces sp. NPDC101181]|uniref:nitroreductase n=1 Tax=Streptomyces sp. NPDC101181 TaxID=3366125 RepID=UPI00381B779D
MPHSRPRPPAPGATAAPRPGLPGAGRSTSVLLRRALADARSPRTPRVRPYVPERPFPWTGAGLPLGTGDAPVDLDRVLRLSLGAPPGTPGRLRPVPSAGALHPVRVHLLVGTGCSLPPGRYAYDPRAHRAHPRGPAPADVPPGALAVLTVAVARTVAHYGHRAWPLLLLDAGHAAAALALAAPPGGVRVCLDADGALLSAAAGLPAPADRRAWPGFELETPLAAVRWTPQGTPAGDAAEVLRAWATLPLGAAPTPRSGAEIASPREIAATRHLLGLLAASPRRPGGTWHPAPRPGPVTDGTLRARRSAAPEDLTRPPGTDPLRQVLGTARAARPDGPAWTVATGGAAPALYTAAPDGTGLGLLATGDARPTLARWAAHQRWLCAVGAVLLAHGCPTDAPPALIRGSHLTAGYAAGTAQLHATALGLGSRPIGSWQQADLGAALGDAPGRDWIVHGLVVAAPTTQDPDPARPLADRIPAAPAPTPPHTAPTGPPGEEERP